MPHEIASKGNDSILINEDALDRLQKARELLNAPMTINSAFRDKAHNKKVGGADNSLHTVGRAFDIAYRLNGYVLLDRRDLYEACKMAGFTGFGFYNTFLHVDTGPKRTWGTKWPELT